MLIVSSLSVAHEMHTTCNNVAQRSEVLSMVQYMYMYMHTTRYTPAACSAAFLRGNLRRGCVFLKIILIQYQALPAPALTAFPAPSLHSPCGPFRVR